MTIKPARTEDLDDLVVLLAAYQSLDETSDTIPDDEANRQFLKGLLADNDGPNVLFIGRSSGGELIGFLHISMHPSALDGCRVAHITDLFVHPDFREQGFGQQLFNHALRWAKTKKHPRVVWFVENMNLTAQYMFDRMEHVTQTGWLRYSHSLSGN
jgi:GNAT superfamily N-acetyltransferase